MADVATADASFEATGRQIRGDVRPPGEPRRVGYLYVLPGLLIYAAFVLVPFGHTFWISFHAWDGITPSEWVGLDNYRRVGDPSGGRT